MLVSFLLVKPKTTAARRNLYTHGEVVKPHTPQDPRAVRQQHFPMQTDLALITIIGTMLVTMGYSCKPHVNCRMGDITENQHHIAAQYRHYTNT